MLPHMTTTRIKIMTTSIASMAPTFMALPR